MRITRGKTAGLIIDIQENLLPVIFEKEELIRKCRILIEGLTILNIPLMVTQQYTKGLGETVEGIKSKVTETEYIEKISFSCCDEPLVIERLSKIKAHNIVICGIESHVCVLQTAVDLKALDYNPIVVMDCVSSRSLENIKLAKERFRHEGIMMASYESILFELTRTASAPEFKAISKLVK